MLETINIDTLKHDQFHACLNLLLAYYPAALTFVLLEHYILEKPETLFERGQYGLYLLASLLLTKFLVNKYKCLVGYAPLMVSALCMIILVESTIN